MIGEQQFSERCKHSVFTSDLLIALGQRAAAAAGDIADTFQVPEFEPVAVAVAADCRAERTCFAARRWVSDGASYHDLIRLCASYVLEIEAIVPVGEPVYIPKVRDELEPLLALWPHVLALPTITPLSARDLIRLRAFPVHPLGVGSEAVWADGRQVSPAEFFFHDLDHARFKVREDLLAMDVQIPDAYRDGTTFDPLTERHRSILPEALGKVGPSLWSNAAKRYLLVESMFNRIDALPNRSLASAAEWLLFQILHEKSFPVDIPTLRRELATPHHVKLLQSKFDKDFYDRNAPSTETMAQLNAARDWLLQVLS